MTAKKNETAATETAAASKTAARKTAAKPAPKTAVKTAAAKAAAVKTAETKTVAAVKPASAKTPAKTANKTAVKTTVKPVAKTATKTAVANKPSEKAKVHSMTGFANVSAEIGSKRVSLEIRAVNHRYLDVQFRMPEDLRHLEGALREQIAAAATRGKLECRIQVQDAAQAVQGLEVNENLVAQLAELNKKWRKQHDLAKLSVADVLRFPGVLASQTEDADAFAQAVKSLLAQALNEFSAARAREGAKLGEHLLERLNGMEEIVGTLNELFPSLLENHMEKVRSRLKEAVGQIDNDRLQQEFALFIQKSDVDEEFSRLRTHIAEVRRIVTESKGSIGKRLDFLMQELNREANTLGSKAIAAECTQASVELKVLIEQMREQVQNIE